jgi:hypothetical protein
MRTWDAGKWIGFAILATGAFARAQQTVPLTLTVRDPTNAAISHVYVEATSLKSGTMLRKESDASGSVILDLPPGGYDIRVGAWPFRWQDRLLDVRGAYAFPINLALEENMGGSQVTMMVPPPSEGTNLSGAQSGASAAPAKADVLTITAGPGQRGVFTPETFRDLPHQTVTIFDHHTNANETYSGVPLMDLLAKLGVPHGKDLMGKALAQYVVATGLDGYKSVVALGEIDPEFHPGQVLVCDAMDGKPLGAAGPFRLIVTEDKRPARSVRNLVSLEVKTAE